MVVAHRHWADAELMTINKRQRRVCACPRKSTMVNGTVCGAHTCGVPTHGIKEWPLGPACLGTVWVGAVEWVWPSRADGCFSVNTWNKLGGSMKIFVTY